MTTWQIPIWGSTAKPDNTGECFVDSIDNQITTLTTGPMKNNILTLKVPTADTGIYGTFRVPLDYSGSAKIVVTGVLDGTTSAVVLALEFSYLPVADNESIDTGWVENATGNSGSLSGGGWADREQCEIGISLTSGNFSAEDEVYYYLKRDYSGDGYGGDYHVTGIYFEYADA